MAEFCLDCWNKMNGTRHSKRKYVLSKDLDFCEGCGEFKHVVIMGLLFMLSIFLPPISSVVCLFLLIQYAVISVVYGIVKGRNCE